MDLDVAVSSGAAATAAILSGVNLYLSGRRDRGRWLRETTVDAFAALLEASWAHNVACTTVARPLTALSAEQRRALRDAVVDAHDRQTDTLTQLRLIAPSAVVGAAEILHNAEHELAHACLLEALSDDDLKKLLDITRAARGRFLEAARRTLGLADTAGIAHPYKRERWALVKNS